ncbi:pentapeptide repeat-containing protein [Streptomyces sp. NPDC047017]|uniref:pentapeptide repeat-containing protein n=1 Tax=Streptomyces sp. NPDC047017 TaxID=3155024 RepID=UPI0033F148C0
MTPAVGQQRDVYVHPIQSPQKPKVHPNPRSATADEFDDDAVLHGVLLDGTVLSGREAEIVEMERSRVANARLNGISLRQSLFSDSEFDTVDFANARALDTSLLRCRLTASRLTGSHWRAGKFTDVTLDGGRADLAQFRASQLRRVVFQDVNLLQADFQGAELAHVRFEGCDLTGAQFAHCKMTRVEFSNCTMLDVGGTAGLKGAIVRGPGGQELALSLARDAGILIEP